MKGLLPLLLLAGISQTWADDAEDWSAHVQFTNVSQWHPSFSAPYSGQNSMNPNANSNETSDITLYAGLRLAGNSEIWINPEIDQGFGLSNTVGMAGYPSGEAYKVGANPPYQRLPRFFYRKTIDLGGATQEVASGENQFAGSRTADNIVLTLGKFSVVDIFDTNSYAHDPRVDFMNWSVIESGAYDYAADAWGYTYGASIEWTRSWWTLRGGFFDTSKTPNSTKLDPTFSQHEFVGELEERHQIMGHPGKLKLLGFVNHAVMGSYEDAILAARGGVPDMALVRRGSSRPGIALNLEQQISQDLGSFLRACYNDGSKEALDFTEINRSLAGGISLKGTRWGRSGDTFGLAAAINGLSDAARAY
ncbi:MAG TPA: carbohydrate porin, partial [Burkholderiales bacterium]|nr:carbohydrate porin [Burkholderiales bacterium]